MSDISAWNRVSTRNNANSPNGFPEGMSPAGLNDSMREVMAAAARFYQTLAGTVTTTGSATAYLLSFDETFSAVPAGRVFTFKAHAANTGSATLNINSTGAKQIRNFDRSVLSAGQLRLGRVCSVLYDGNRYVLLNDYAPFDLHEDVTTELTAPHVNDRMVVSDESASGAPNKYVKLSALQSFVEETITDRGVYSTASVTSRLAPGDIIATGLGNDDLLLVNVMDGSTLRTVIDTATSLNNKQLWLRTNYTFGSAPARVVSVSDQLVSLNYFNGTLYARLNNSSASTISTRVLQLFRS